MAMTRLSDPTPRMTLSRALLSEALRLARSPLAVVHLVCGLAAGLACGEYWIGYTKLDSFVRAGRVRRSPWRTQSTPGISPTSSSGR
ncbi:hypothetical protein ACTNEU_10125, partial [Ellagibacter isourolithinifaciens]